MWGRPTETASPVSRKIGEISGTPRIYAVGLVNGLEITVVYADRGEDERRIISAWRSQAHERRFYWQNVEG